jgi:opacity protein-like surface antigen
MRGLLLILMSLCATGAIAENAWYAGVGAGMTNLRNGSNLDADVGDIDTWKAGFQLFGGYKLGEQWAVEFGYLDFGEDSETTPGDPNNPDVPDNKREYSAAGIYVNGQYHIPIASRVSLDLDGGWVFAEAEDTKTIVNSFDGGQTDKYDDSGAMLGLAFTWRTTDSLYLRGSANYFLIDFDKTIKNPWRIGADLIWDF